MWKMVGKIIIILFVALIVFWLFFYFKFFRIAKEIHEGNKMAVESFNPNTVAGKKYAEIDRQVTKKMEHEIKGYEYLKQNKFDLAIQEFKQMPSEWESRWSLSEAYEASGDYKNALAEIDWLLKKNPRADVIRELQPRKEKLLKLMSSSK